MPLNISTARYWVFSSGLCALSSTLLSRGIDAPIFIISSDYKKRNYDRQTFNISHTLVGNIIVDNSDVVGASPVGAAPTTSSLST